MVLHHVADRAGTLVIRRPPLDADGLGRRDLHVIDVAAVPHRLVHPVAEPEHQQVLDGFLAEIVVDAEHLLFVEVLVHDRVERAGTGQVGAERLLDDDAAPAGRGHLRKARLAEPLDHGLVDAGRNGEVVQDALRPVDLVEPRLDALVQRGIAELAGDVEDATRQ